MSSPGYVGRDPASASGSDPWRPPNTSGTCVRRTCGSCNTEEIASSCGIGVPLLTDPGSTRLASNHDLTGILSSPEDPRARLLNQAPDGGEAGSASSISMVTVATRDALTVKVRRSGARPTAWTI